MFMKVIVNSSKKIISIFLIIMLLINFEITNIIYSLATSDDEINQGVEEIKSMIKKQAQEEGISINIVDINKEENINDWKAGNSIKSRAGDRWYINTR